MGFFCSYQGFGVRGFLARLRPWVLCRRCRAWRRDVEVTPRG